MQKEHRKIEILRKWVNDNGIEILGGVYTALFVLIVTPHVDLITKIIIEFLAVVSGIVIAQNIYYNLRFKKIRSIINADQKLLEEPKRHGKEIFLFERNILSRYHTYLDNDFKKLHDANEYMTFYEYEDLLKEFIYALEESRKKKFTIKGTCLILPKNFDKDNPYAKMWERVYNKLHKFDCEFTRILCDHNKDNLINAINDNKDKFKIFCDWNKKTKFGLYIYKDSYDELRRYKQLPFNDFLIYNDKIVIGGEVLEDEKISTPDKKTKNIKVGINFSDANRYNILFNEIKDDSTFCMRVDLNSSNMLDEVLEFLNG